MGIPVQSGEVGSAVGPERGRPPGAQHNTHIDTLRKATLGEYEILTELGHGGMAAVYLAHDLALDRKVAIKVLSPALLLMGEGMVERFKREARTAAALSHPHIIPIYAVKESEHVLYFVMKHVQGRALDAVIHEVGPLPIAMVQTILAQVGDALGYAHRHGVIHRDIKSANIMLDEDGWAVVTDFGIAKVVEAQGLTVTGVTVGTPTYMSPEQCATHEVTGASDQYSLGVVAYEMLTGRLPFEGNSTMSVMYAHFNERPRPVTELRPDCPPNLGAGVMRMLEKDPLARWPTMDDVVAVCGRPSLRHDDPVRGEMITLAQAGGHSERLDQLKTPTSPIVLSRPRGGGRSAAPTVVRGRGLGRWQLWRWGLGALVVAAGVVLWRVAPWRTSSSAPPLASVDTAPPAHAPAAVPTGTVPVRPAPPAATPAPRQPSRARVPTSQPPGAAPESAARAAVTHREDSLVRSLRARALSAMSRAIEAGATPAELARGDTVFKGAESLTAQNRGPEAMVQLATAASLWTEAERAARSRPKIDTAKPRPAEPPAAPKAAPAPVDPRPDIQRVIDDYARALESRDVDQVRRAYPGLTPSQQESWRGFFESVRNLKAGLTVTAVSYSGVTAEAIVSGVYAYDNASTGRAERRPVTFRAILAVDSTGWRLMTIR
ncbi:MAG TPA: serine/threonine-protein kinase [Gemmatimonadales bacterium]|nr:serine/threonine-protein kinase [Gemmatimonadales bacterium]